MNKTTVKGNTYVNINGTVAELMIGKVMIIIDEETIVRKITSTVTEFLGIKYDLDVNGNMFIITRFKTDDDITYNIRTKL